MRYHHHIRGVDAFVRALIFFWNDEWAWRISCSETLDLDRHPELDLLSRD